MRAVRPFLIVKAAQADIAFEFAETVNYARVTPELFAKREAFMTKMKAAKRAAYLEPSYPTLS